MKTCKTKKITGCIHSLETFGTHEGPGIRFVVFLQGCLARCLYCHNPDTWEEGAGTSMDAQEIAQKLERCLPYINSSKGGITISGGEPLLQMDFLSELFSLCKDKSIHTAIDTGAFYHPQDQTKLRELLALTDLFIVDVKAADKKLHEQITSKGLDEVLTFIAMLEDSKKQYWLRYVLVPGLNDTKQDLKKLDDLLRPLRYCVNFEFLPYHTLGKHKWEGLALDYPLKDKGAATAEDLQKAQKMISGFF